MPFAILTVILVLATITDIQKHKIPNALSLGGIVIGLTLSAYQNGFDGLLQSLQGMGLGFALFIPFYLLRGMAAGDVKLIAAVGAFVGPKLALAAVAGTLISGSVLAIAYAVFAGGGLAYLQRYGQMAKVMLTTHQLTYFKPTENDAGSKRFPYALAIMVGTYAGYFWVNQSFPFV